MTTLTAPTPCQRCGTTPVDVATMTGPNQWAPGCTCYPHPPLCPFCHQALAVDRCETAFCWALGLVIPDPDVDPLWNDPDDRSIA